MRIIISSQQQYLKKEQTSRPNPGSPAEPRQKKFSQQQLHLEQQKCAGKDSESEGKTTHKVAKIHHRGLIQVRNLQYAALTLPGTPCSLPLARCFRKLSVRWASRSF